MSALLPIQYQLDPTGSSVNNKIVNELHVLENTSIRSLAPIHSPFSKDSVVIIDSNSGQQLAITDYKFYSLRGLASAKYGREYYDLVIITNPSISSNVKITYQTLGGEYLGSSEATKALLDAVYSDNRVSSWSSVVNEPEAFDSSKHLHAVGDVIGFEYLVTALERLRDTIIVSSSLRADEVVKFVNTRLIELNTRTTEHNANIDSVLLVLNSLQNHITDRNNPHQNTKADVGLGNVENLSLATLSDLITPSPTNPKYVTNQVLTDYLANYFNTLDSSIQNNLTQVSLDVNNAVSQSHTAVNSINALTASLSEIADLSQKASNVQVLLTTANTEMANARTRAAQLMADYISNGN